MKCHTIKQLPGMPTGWACCQCNTFNVESTEACALCKHWRCDRERAAPAPASSADLPLQYARAERDDAETDYGALRQQLTTALYLDPGTSTAAIVHAVRVSHRAADLFAAQLAGDGRHVVAMLEALRKNPERNGVELVGILRGLLVEKKEPGQP